MSTFFVKCSTSKFVWYNGGTLYLSTWVQVSTLVSSPGAIRMANHYCQTARACCRNNPWDCRQGSFFFFKKKTPVGKAGNNNGQSLLVFPACKTFRFRLNLAQPMHFLQSTRVETVLVQLISIQVLHRAVVLALTVVICSVEMHVRMTCSVVVASNLVRGSTEVKNTKMPRSSICQHLKIVLSSLLLMIVSTFLWTLSLLTMNYCTKELFQLDER